MGRLSLPYLLKGYDDSNVDDKLSKYFNENDIKDVKEKTVADL